MNYLQNVSFAIRNFQEIPWENMKTVNVKKGDKHHSCFVSSFSQASNSQPSNFRMTTCKYSRIGCPWRGPSVWCVEHEKECVHPKKSGAEVMDALQVIEKKTEEERLLYESIFDLLSYEKMTFNGM